MKMLNNFYNKFPGSYVAYIGFVFSVVFMLIAILLYNDPNFTIFTHYISDLGASTRDSALFWNISMLITVPIRLLFGFYLLKFLEKKGASEKSIKITMTFMLISAIGSILIALNPHDISRLFHMLGAFIYFIGVVIIQINISRMELKVENIPKYLPFVGFLVVACYVLFLGFEISELISEAFRLLACFFEWMAFFSLMAWLVLHGYYTQVAK
ncbi:MAG: DUF998 domain-containing protein [Candidatus Lokiarchaeota archaeon]|nr:DUF998 domain-containing protein [Candidatus Lokiarchaeota archaeon]